MAERAVIGYYLNSKHTLSAKSPWRGVYVHFGEPPELGKTLFRELVKSDAHVMTLIDAHKCGFSIFPTKPYYEEDCNYFTNKSISTTIKRKSGNYTYQSVEIAGIRWLYLFNMREKKLNIFEISLEQHRTAKKETYKPKIKLVKSVSYSKNYPINWAKIGVKKY